MSAWIVGSIFIVIGGLQLFALRNTDSWWAWTNWQARGWRKALGDESYKALMTACYLLLIGLGIFFIYDDVIGVQMISEWIESKG